MRLQVKQAVGIHHAAPQLTWLQGCTARRGITQEDNGVHVWRVPLGAANHPAILVVPIHLWVARCMIVRRGLACDSIGAA